MVVLGDLHGDLTYLRAILQNNGVLDANDNWLNPTTKVVSVGDTIGRGHQDKDMLEFIKSMSEKHEVNTQIVQSVFSFLLFFHFCRSFVLSFFRSFVLSFFRSLVFCYFVLSFLFCSLSFRLMSF
jgi:hypothetical protein